MIVTCNECKSSFNLNESLLKQTGSKVRCSKCKNVFIAYPPAPMEDLEKTAEVIPDLEAEKPETPDEAQEDLDLEPKAVMEPKAEEGAEEAEAAADEDELDLSDLEKIIEEDEAPEAATAEAEAGEDELEDFDLDFDLDLDLEPEAEEGVEEAKAEAEADEDELDLSDLEKIIEEDEAPEAATAEAEAGEDELEDFDLDLDLDLEPEAEEGVEEAKAEVKADEDELEDLDLDIEPELAEDSMESEVEIVSDEAGAEVEQEADEFDLSDIEEMLEPEEEPVTEEGIEIEPEHEAETAEFDTSDIEKMLDVDEGEESEKEVEIEMEGIELEIEDSDQGELDTEEVIVEEEILEEQIDAKTTEFDMEAFVDEVEAEKIDESIEPDEEIKEDEVIAEPLKKPSMKKRLSMPVRIMLIIVLLGGGAYAANVLLSSMNIKIKIPYVSDLFKPKIQDVGNLKINTLDIKSKFVENSKTGRLFVITGQAKNEYSKARGLIKITGKLFTTGKKLAQTKTVFCGNVISDLDLATMDLDTINKRLVNRFGDNRSNAKVRPNKAIPFMIVFSKLPNNLEEFTINVVGSTPIK